MLVMPYSHDQPDNARRVRHLGVAKVIQRKSYGADAAAKRISSLLEDKGYAHRASEVAAVVAEEDGVATACNALERLVRPTT
jgi:UDP:flavonoid glycosyltransferase YjiC (YdhE family)